MTEYCLTTVTLQGHHSLGGITQYVQFHVEQESAMQQESKNLSRLQESRKQ